MYELSLPEDYAVFLQEAGNGGAGPGYGLERFGYVAELSTGQKMRRNLLYDIKRSEQMASLFDKNDDVELWP
jgi:hypothetical protein